MSAPNLEESAWREEILSAARTIFAHYGFRRASLEAVARENRLTELVRLSLAGWADQTTWRERRKVNHGK